MGYENHPILKSFINGDVTKRDGHFGGYIYSNKRGSQKTFRIELRLNHSQLQMEVDGVSYNLVER